MHMHEYKAYCEVNLCMLLFLARQTSTLPGVSLQADIAPWIRPGSMHQCSKQFFISDKASPVSWTAKVHKHQPTIHLQEDTTLASWL